MTIDYQEAYWDLLIELRVQIGYLHLYQLDSEGKDNKLKMFLAIASSGSVAGWVVWNYLGLLWAIIIASSQVINVIKGYLPWERRLKAISGARAELEMLLIFAERHWYDVSEGNLTTKEIHNLTVDIKQDRVKLEQKYFKESPLPLQQDFINEAERQVQLALTN